MNNVAIGSLIRVVLTERKPINLKVPENMECTENKKKSTESTESKASFWDTFEIPLVYFWDTFGFNFAILLGY